MNGDTTGDELRREKSAIEKDLAASLPGYIPRETFPSALPKLDSSQAIYQREGLDAAEKALEIAKTTMKREDIERAAKIIRDGKSGGDGMFRRRSGLGIT